jgi:hypothetical protein
MQALGRQTTVRPGWLSKLLGWSLAMLPRWGQVAIIGQVMKGMTAHQAPRSVRPSRLKRAGARCTAGADDRAVVGSRRHPHCQCRSACPARRPRHRALELRDACIVAAQEVIAERGVENLSLREVARKLGVSHQAPYKHYPSRDHLLAEVMRRCFQRFAAHLDARPASTTRPRTWSPWACSTWITRSSIRWSTA